MVIAIGFVSSTLVASGATPTGQFVNRVYRDDKGDHKYVVFVPAGYSTATKWPTVLYLHGAHSRGQDGRAPLVAGLAPAIKLRAANYPFLVVFPQCENTHSRLLGGWSDESDDADRALKILDAVERDFSVDQSREILMGSSMGGSGVWEIGARTPARWSALVPSGAQGKPEHAAKVARIPVWSFHVKGDPMIPVSTAQNMVATVRAAGGRFSPRSAAIFMPTAIWHSSSRHCMSGCSIQSRIRRTSISPGRCQPGSRRSWTKIRSCQAWP